MKLNIKSKWFIFRKDSDERNQFLLLDVNKEKGKSLLRIYFTDDKQKQDSFTEFINRANLSLLRFNYFTYNYNRKDIDHKMRNIIGTEESINMMKNQIEIIKQRLINYQLFLDFKKNHDLHYSSKELELKEFIKFNNRLNPKDNNKVIINVFDEYAQIFRSDILEDRQFSSYKVFLNQWNLLVNTKGKDIGVFAILLEKVQGLPELE